MSKMEIIASTSQVVRLMGELGILMEREENGARDKEMKF